MTFNTVSKSISLLLLLTVFISCGSDRPMVDDIQVSPRVEDGDIIVSISANLSLGNLSFPSTTLPINIPSRGGEIGHVSLSSTTSGNYINIDLNMSDAMNINTQAARLPNGVVLPLIGSNELIVISLGKNRNLYLAINGSQVALGVAIPIKTFDSLGRKVGTAAVFPLFNKNNIIGTAGIFTSKSAGKNGIGLFVDISGTLNNTMINELVADMPQQEQAALAYNSLSVSKKKNKSINREMYKLHKKRKRLKLY